MPFLWECRCQQFLEKGQRMQTDSFVRRGRKSEISIFSPFSTSNGSFNFFLRARRADILYSRNTAPPPTPVALSLMMLVSSVLGNGLAFTVANAMVSVRVCIFRLVCQKRFLAFEANLREHRACVVVEVDSGHRCSYVP